MAVDMRSHNGGPPCLPLTAKSKLECIQSILERDDLTAAQKCIGAGIVLEADREWSAAVKTPALQRYASARDRETVFRATRELDRKAVISKSSGRGEAGRFQVLPPRVMTAVMEAYEELTTSRVETDQISKSGRVKPDGITGGTSGLVDAGTSRVETDKPRARIETPSGLLFLDNTNTPLPPKGPTKADALEAFNAYNETALRCSLPQAVKFTPDRERRIVARLKDYGLDGWKRALANIEKSAFLTGGTHHGFRADLTFICQAESFGKLHDGGYGNGRHATTQKSASDEMRSIEAIVGKEKFAEIMRGRQ